MKYPDQPGYVAHSDTSREAAERFTRKDELRRMILRWLLDAGVAGLTSDEAFQMAQGRDPDIDKTTIGARFTELHAEGAIIKTKAKRMTRHDRPASVYVHAICFDISMGSIPLTRRAAKPASRSPADDAGRQEIEAGHQLAEMLLNMATVAGDTITIKLSPLDRVMVKKLAEKAGLKTERF